MQDPDDVCEKFLTNLATARATADTYDPMTHSKYVDFKRCLDDGDGDTSLRMCGDGDLVVDKVQRSLYCPLTKKLLEKPVTSKQCHHSYSHESIMEHIRKRCVAV